MKDKSLRKRYSFIVLNDDSNICRVSLAVSDCLHVIFMVDRLNVFDRASYASTLNQGRLWIRGNARIRCEDIIWNDHLLIHLIWKTMTDCVLFFCAVLLLLLLLFIHFDTSSLYLTSCVAKVLFLNDYRTAISLFKPWLIDHLT